MEFIEFKNFLDLFSPGLILLIPKFYKFRFK